MKITVDELIKNDIAKSLSAGDKVELTGYIYTARDAAHKRILELIAESKPLPFNLEEAVIYYAGPTGTPPGGIIGSCGPTTSGRMDKFTPDLLDLGLAATIGKGERSNEVVEAIIRNKSVYFAAIGGAGALASKSVKSLEVIAFPELGCESVKKLYIECFPLVVAIDCNGGNVYIDGKRAYGA